MENFELFDKTFTLSKITAYSLTLEIDYNHLVYTIVDQIRKNFVALIYRKFEQKVTPVNFLDTVDQYIKSDTYLQKHYKEVDFIYPSTKFILVPEEFFDKQNLKLFFQAGNELDEGEEIQFNYIPEIKTYLLFAIASDITNFFVYRFPEINFYHQGIPLIKTYSKISKGLEGKIMVVNFRKNIMMDILVMEDGKLLFYNIFKCAELENNIYIIMRVLKDFGYDVHLELMGDIGENDKLYKSIKKYMPNVEFAKLQKGFFIDFEQPIEIHRFANLFYISD